MTDREAMQQALRWADQHGEAVFAGGGMDAVDSMNEWAQALRSRLAQPEQQPQRKPLTDNELADLWYKQSTDWMEFARAIETVHGIKGEA